MLKSKYIFYVFALVSIVSGLSVFYSTKYKHATLKIYAQTFEKGSQRIYVKASGAKKSIPLVYETKDDEGYNYNYPIVMPSVSIDSLKIAPLGEKGKFLINRIELLNEKTTYTWDDQYRCSEIVGSDGINITRPCGSNAPVLIANADLSIDITGVVSVDSQNTDILRVTLALVLMFVIFTSYIWLARPLSQKKAVSIIDYAVCIAWLLCLIMYIRQLYFIFVYSVDLPSWEEWSYFETNALPRGLTLEWLFSFSGEHLVVFTKIMAWINQLLLDLDFTAQRIVNYLLFGCLLLTINHLKTKITGRDCFIIFPAFLLFLVSNINHENYTNTFASQTHFALLFSIFALYYSFEINSSKFHSALFVTSLCFGIISFSAGPVIAVCYLICLTLYTVAGIINNRIDKSNLRRLFIMYVPIGITLAYWYYGYKLPSVFAHPPRVSPLEYPFWECFLNLVSFGFGFESEQIILGIVCFTIVVCPIILLLYNCETRWQAGTWQLVAAITAIIVVLATISMGRGWIQGAAKTSRYAEISFMLIPYSALAWWIALRKTTWGYKVLMVLWIFCFAGYYNNWSEKPYLEKKQNDIYVLDCLHLINTSSELCPDNHPVPIQYTFEQAKNLNIKFTREFGR
jgi:hypothetical protein